MDLFIPGRICLFGEHSDWAGGYRRVNPKLEKGHTLICGTDQGIYATVTPHPRDLLVSATTPDGERLGPRTIPMEPDALLEVAARGGFWSYIAGVAYQAVVHHEVKGLVIDNYRTNLPIQKGLSSSAAICVLTARAFNLLYDLKLTTRGEMELAYEGEITTPSRCGRMDQGCAFGNRPVLMTFDGDHLHTSEKLAGQDLYLVIADLQAHKDTMKILERLNACYPHSKNAQERGVQELLGPTNRRIVEQSVSALEAGDAQRLGALMNEAQSLFDRYAAPVCPEELTAPVLHHVLQYGPLQPHIFGGKGVGSQGDGAAQFIARSQADQEAAIEIIQTELGMPCLKLTIPAASMGHPSPLDLSMPAELERSQKSASRAHPVRKAVIPVAGLSTRLFPATRAVKKVFFPIIDRDGLAKPAILLIVNEALEAGIEKVILVVQEKDLDDFQAFFGSEPTPELWDGLPAPQKRGVRRILETNQHLSFAVQTTQDGFGHAVYSARAAVGDEPFLLMLGDHLYRSNNDEPCADQLLAVYEQHSRNVLGLRRIKEEDLAHYGVVSGHWLQRDQILEITQFVEKPTADLARASLQVEGLPNGEYLAVFGQYVLQAGVFDHLGAQISGQHRERGEFQLTSALEQLRAEEGFLGLVVDGQAYDIGTPASYLHTIGRFAAGN